MMKRREFLVGTALGAPTLWLLGCERGVGSPEGPGAAGAAGSAGAAGGTGAPAELDTGAGVPTVENLGTDWRFALADAGESAADPGFDDGDWAEATLPHTGRVEALVIGASGTSTYQWQGICWYRRRLILGEEAEGRRVFLLFDGAMNVAEVRLDGKLLGEHLGGWLPFGFEISELVFPGREHLLAVRLENLSNSTTGPKPLSQLDYCYYHGLYRPVRVVVKSRLHLTDPILADKPASGGVFVTYPEVSRDRARVTVQAHVRNEEAAARRFTVRATLVDAEDSVAVGGESEETALEAASDTEVAQTLELSQPKLWSPKQPYLYTLRVEVLSEGVVMDQETLRIGIRRIEISTEGFVINGERVFLRGCNRHQEYPYIGYALSAEAQYRDAKKIKDAGFDFIRLSHYTHSPAFMDACDELGIVVMDCIPGWQYFSDSEAFIAVQLENCRRMLRRDRNHPCVILWEVSLNESSMGSDFIDQADAIAHEEYPGDQCFTAGWKRGYDVFVEARQHGGCEGITTRPCLVSEYGDWEYYAQNAGLEQDGWEDLAPEEANSRQLRWQGERALLQQATNFQEAHNDNLRTMAFADSLWVMYDYNRGYAPDLESSGCMDIFRLPKFSYYFFQSQRDPGEEYKASACGAMVFIASHCSAESSLKIRVFSNCEEVELFLNGTSLGRQAPDADRISTNIAHPPFTFTLSAFEPGTLEAVAYLGGQEAARHSVSTPGPIRELVLSLDESGKPFATQGKDVVFVHAALRDAAGAPVPDAWENVSFGVTGAAALVGQNPFSSDGGIASILLQAEAASPKAAVYALCIVVDAEGTRVLGASLSARAEPEDFELRITTDGSEPDADSALCTEPVLADRVRAALLVDGAVVATADTATERFRVRGSGTSLVK